MTTEKRKIQVKTAVKNWRKNTKARMVAAMGGKCQICGYDKCLNALAFHHINPTEKELSFNKMRANPQGWLTIVSELRKCILLCNNCHSEIHAGETSLPTKFVSFNEDYVDYKTNSKIL